MTNSGFKFILNAKNKISGSIINFDFSIFLILSFLLTILWLIWYIHAYQQYYYGDELFSLSHSREGGWIDGFKFQSQYKPRWLTNALTTTLYRNFSNNRGVLISVGMAFQIIGSILFYGCIRNIELSKGSAALLSIATAITRFNLYGAYEANLAIIEGAAWLLFITSFYFWTLYIRYNINFYCFLSTISILLCGLSHERYLPVALIVVSMPIARMLFLKIRFPLPLLGLNTILPAFMFLALFLLMPASSLAGTGGSPVSVFSFHTSNQIYHAILQAFGINIGPTYLTGEMKGKDAFIQDMPFLAYVIIVIYILSYIIINKDRKNNSQTDDQLPVSIIIFPIYSFFILIFLASISIRQEMRWLHEPVLLLIFVLIFCIKKLRITEVLINILSLCLMISSTTLFKSQSLVYYASASRNAITLGSLFESGLFDPKSTQINCDESWTFQGDLFAKLNFLRNKVYLQNNPSPFFTYSKIEIINGKASILSINTGRNSLCDSANKGVPIANIENDFHLKELIIQPDWSKIPSISDASHWTCGSGCKLIPGVGLQLSSLDKNGVIFQRIQIDSTWSHLKCIYEAQSDNNDAGSRPITILAQVNWLKDGKQISAKGSRVEVDKNFKFQEVDFVIPSAIDSCLIYVAGPEISTLKLRKVYVFIDD